MKSRLLLPAGSVLLALPLWAADTPPRSDELEQVIVTGTRHSERTAVNSSVPVDVVSQTDLQAVPSSDLNDKLAQLVPSFNVARAPLFDGTVYVRPATLRGLSPDQTLVLVNGKRRHRSAYVDNVNQGAQAVDLSQIPEIGIRRVEVLRDGASALYGSDAIAGVINVILDERPGFAVTSQAAQYYRGDGRNLQLAARGGFGLGEAGAGAVSLEYVNGKETDRGAAVNKIGLPELESWRLFYNGAYALQGGAEVYAFGNYSYTDGISDFNYRPNNSTIYGRSYYQDNPPFTDPDYSLLDVYPDGFIPRFGAKTSDFSTLMGLRGELRESLSWDLSARYGRNQIAYTLDDTINASLGPDSPTSFDDGKLISDEFAANLEFNYAWQTALSKPVNVAFGTEWRREGYQVKAGEPASYESGDFSDLVPGSNGFPGFTPESAGKWHRSSTAGYVDLEADVSERLTLGGAGRFEHYSDFGNSWAYKLTARLQVFEPLSLRAAYSTGFHAPTPGQQNLVKLSQGPDPLHPPPEPQIIQTSGLIAPTNPVAVAVGGKALVPEKSQNYSAGFVLRPLQALTLSVDFYRADIDKRLGFSQQYALTDEQRDELVDQGVTLAASLDQFQFFVNGYDTRTEGVDVVGSYTTGLPLGSLTLTGAYNYNSTALLRGDANIVSENLVQSVEDRLPHDTANLSATYSIGRLGLLAKARYYSSWVDALPFLPASWNQHVGAETFIDFAASYAVTPAVKVTAGIENLTNNYPDRLTGILAGGGTKYPLLRPYEAEGGHYYLRLAASF